jgi:hypothetical protein
VSAYDTLRQAILEKKPCVIAKPGEPERKICPYRLGRSSKGDQNVIYYQYDGYTSRPNGLAADGSQDNWRCNHVADIAIAQIVQERWHEPIIKPKTRGKCVVLLDVEVQYYD